MSGKRFGLAMLLLSVATLAMAMPLAAETAEDPNQSLPWILDKTGVAADDGEWLATDVYRPRDRAARRAATVLIRTPYGRHQYRGGDPLIDRLIDRGVHVVIQDTRGKWGSTGTFRPFVDECRDGLATLDWIERQPWSNGVVGMWGNSYPGFNALLLVPARHRALRAVFSLSGWLDGESINRPGGALHLMLAIPWLVQQETERTRSIVDVDLESMFDHLPLIDAFRAVGLESEAWRDPSVLEAKPCGEPSETPSAAIFHVTGWYDFVASASLDVHRRFAELGLDQRLLIGPWQHNQVFSDFTTVGDEDLGPASTLGPEGIAELAADWLVDRLAGATEPDAPRARVFVMGENRWRDFTAWPPTAAEPRRWFLSSTPSGGTLVADPDDIVEGRRGLAVDPMHPVPTWGGANFHFFGSVSGILDQRRIEQRDDVLTWTSPPLAEAVTVAGATRAVVHLSTTGRDADLVAKWTVVGADGRSRLVVDGIVRASSVHGQLTPGRAVPLIVDLGSTAIRVAAGERLRLLLAGTNFPKFDRNPHTGGDPRLAETLLPARHVVHSTADLPSYLELSVVPD